MNGIDIAVIVCACAAAVGLIVYFVLRKVRHKDSGCCGCCSECSMCRNGAETDKSAQSEVTCDCCSEKSDRAE